jgi:hypothetical protein
MLTCREHVFNEARTWKRWEGVPLVEGRSVLSDELCNDVVGAYYRFNIGEDEPVDNPVLRNIELVVQNCQRRQAFERRIRNDRGLDPHVPVSIPPPGVPADYSMDPPLCRLDQVPIATSFATDLDEKKLRKDS